jgi:hypothetical protein
MKMKAAKDAALVHKAKSKLARKMAVPGPGQRETCDFLPTHSHGTWVCVFAPSRAFRIPLFEFEKISRHGLFCSFLALALLGASSSSERTENQTARRIKTPALGPLAWDLSQNTPGLRPEGPFLFDLVLAA